MTSATDKKLILVIGATGAQGLAVIDALLAPASSGTPTPYSVRALTRDPSSKRAKELQAKGVECVKGSFEDSATVFEALKGAYGVWSNTDGFTVGEKRELYAGIRLFELAKQVGTVKHYVWSSLDYSFKKGGYNLDYRATHYDGKGKVAEWLKAQPTTGLGEGMTWSVVTSGPYMDMLNIMMFGPLNQRPDGTFVFASPIGGGHVPMIALTDVGFFARYSFDNRAEVSGKDLEVASQMVTWPELVETFKKVTEQKAVFKALSIDEWFGLFENTEIPSFNEGEDGDVTWKENFSSFWRQFRDDIIKRDIDWIKSIHPNHRTLESWMRDKKYTGKMDWELLKNLQDGKGGLGINVERVKAL